MKLVSILIIAVGSMGGCATNTPYNDWSKKEQQMYQYQLTLQVIDTIQTTRAIKCQETSMCRLLEANPIYGSSSSMQRLIGIKLIGNILLYHILALNDIHRERYLKIANYGYSIIVLHNQIMINKVL